MSSSITAPELWGYLHLDEGLPRSAPDAEAVATDHAASSTIRGNWGEITTNGDCCAFGNGGIAAIAGTPRWHRRELAELATSGGHATALATAYNEFGPQLFDHIGGAFTCAIIDGGKPRLLAGIDRMGLHTLYYARENGRLLFGSSAATVLAQCSSDTVLSEQGIYDYVYFHMVPSPQSVFEGLKKLPAATYLGCRDAVTGTTRYWQPSFSQRSAASMAARGVELKQQLRDATERALQGTRAAGTFLSGGLDSSTVTGMLAELTDSSHPAYAIGFDQDGYDEMPFARTSAAHFGVELREYYVTPEDVVAELPTIATSYDEPFGNSSALPAYFCSKKAQEDGIDCLLAGDGGDELFAGNERYAKQQVFGIYQKIPGALRSAFMEPVIAALPTAFPLGNKAKSYISQAKVPLPDRLQSYNFLNRIPPGDIFCASMLERVDTLSPLQLQRQTFHSLDGASELNRMLYLDWQYTLADNDLRKVSHMAAAAGIDVRYPMLDEELVNFSCQIPDNWKLQRGSLRHFYKQSLTGWLPDATINKKKQGFGLPFGLWMQSYRPLNELANESLLRLKDCGYFQQDFLDRLLELHQHEHAAYYGELIWVLTVFDLWLEGRRHAHTTVTS